VTDGVHEIASTHFLRAHCNQQALSIEEPNQEVGAATPYAPEAVIATPGVT